MQLVGGNADFRAEPVLETIGETGWGVEHDRCRIDLRHELAGFALVGAGAANVVPVMFSAAGRQHDMPTHLEVAAVTTMVYAGVLLGPAALGFVAKATSLPMAFGLLVALLLCVAGAARQATRS